MQLVTECLAHDSGVRIHVGTKLCIRKDIDYEPGVATGNLSVVRSPANYDILDKAL